MFVIISATLVNKKNLITSKAKSLVIFGLLLASDTHMAAKKETDEVKVDERNKSLGRHLGTTIRQLRLEHNLTIAEVSERAGISRGMLSKIENSLAATSLETLEQLANALGVTLSKLFQNYNLPRGAAQLVKKGEGMEVVRRGTRVGHTYQLLAYDQGPHKTFEPFLISLEDSCEEFPAFEHPGTEFIHMLEGTLEYRVGKDTFVLNKGDSLTFQGEIPHRPENLIETPIKFLAIIHYDAPGKDNFEE
jgi:transcriptional regulator with XRE-family HTH domain